MIRYFVLIAAFIILINCGSFHYQKTIKFGDGRNATVFFGTEKNSAGVELLVVEFTNDRMVRKESAVENDVIVIWKGVKTEAEKRNLDEAVIKYRYRTGEQNAEGEKVYRGLLFTADRTETGNWSIRKVD